MPLVCGCLALILVCSVDAKMQFITVFLVFPAVLYASVCQDADQPRALGGKERQRLVIEQLGASDRHLACVESRAF